MAVQLKKVLDAAVKVLNEYGDDASGFVKAYDAELFKLEDFKGQSPDLGILVSDRDGARWSKEVRPIDEPSSPNRAPLHPPQNENALVYLLKVARGARDGNGSVGAAEIAVATLRELAAA